MIEFKDVYKKYDNGTEALKGVNLRIERGEFVFIVGASGSGKSTFLKTIMREEVPTSGTIMINNFDLTKMNEKEIPYFRRTMGIVFQDFRLIPNMTVFDNVAFAMRVIGANEKEIRKRVPYVLSLVGLQNKSRSMPNEISGGEQQRVALARALVNNANTIIADEPTGNIDPEMSYEIVDLLNHINENGTTIIMVTHEHELVKKFNHRIVVIDHGKVISDTAEGASLSYDATTGYKPIEEPELTPSMQIIETALEDTTANPDDYLEDSVASEVDDIAAQIAAKVAAAAAGGSIPSAEELISKPVEIEIPTETVEETPAPAVIPTDPEQPITTFADLDNSDVTISPVINVKVSADVIPEEAATEPVPEPAAEPAPEPAPEPAAEQPAPEDNFTSADGVDYSKYFESSEEVQ